MNIAGRVIGHGHPPYIIGEISGEHLGDIHKAMSLMQHLKAAGADAAKFQLYDPIRLAEARGGLHKQAPPPWQDLTLRQLYLRTYTPRDWFPDLFAYGREIGITVFSSVFDEDGVDFLETLGCPAYKISSFSLTDLPLIRKAAATSKPLIISTGMATTEDLRAARDSACYANDNWDVAFLHCISAYPAAPADMNLRAILRLRDLGLSELPIGLSDHSLGTTAAIVATALGASIIEKHITLDRNDGGPDAAFSLEPHEFTKLVADVKDAYASLGTGERPASEAPYRELRRKAV